MSTAVRTPLPRRCVKVRLGPVQSRQDHRSGLPTPLGIVRKVGRDPGGERLEVWTAGMRRAGSRRGKETGPTITPYIPGARPEDRKTLAAHRAPILTYLMRPSRPVNT
jgi:hypothetical protein